MKKRSLSHINQKGEVSMVDVSPKAITLRKAVASANILLSSRIVRAIKQNNVAKGNVLETARIAAIQAAKGTADLIPLCHPIPISHIAIHFRWKGNALQIQSEVSAEARTGVEMEALTAVTIAALVIYDMCKGIDKGMTIGSVMLLEKTGGKSGTYRRQQ